MEIRRYKDSNEYISLLGFGGLRLPMIKGSQYEIDKEEAFEMVDYAISNGINYFDTAYGYHNGKSELFLGEALSRYPRNKYNLATKMPLVSIKSEHDIDNIFNDQLNKCHVQYFDFYLIHNINKTDWEVVEEYKVYEYLQLKQKQGVIRHLGFSFHDTPELLLKVIDTYNWDFAQIQLNYMDWKVQNAKEQYRILKENNIPVIVMEPVRGGTLASLCEKSVKLLRSKNPEASVASWAIRYAASFPEVLTVLSGMSNMAQLQDNIRIMKNFSPLEKDDYSIIEEALAIYQETASVPCTGCRYCISHCVRNIEIPSILFIYNNYLQGKDKRDFLFRYNVLRNDKQAHYCIKCNQCAMYCPQHIDIPHWLDKINKLQKIFEFKKRLFNRIKRYTILVKIYRKIKNLYHK